MSPESRKRRSPAGTRPRAKAAAPRTTGRATRARPAAPVIRRAPRAGRAPDARPSAAAATRAPETARAPAEPQAPAAATPGTPPRASLGDAQLVVMAQGGDTRAFDELVRRYRDKVYRLSFKILRHEDDAAEALQDAFLSAYRGLKNFKAESTFSTWLYRIATNASLMKYRKRRDNHISLEQSQSHNEDAEGLELPDWSTQPVDELLTRETREVLEDSAGRLPEELLTVFLLRDVEGQSNAQVAEVLDLSVAAVKSRLHRARLALRNRLNRYFADKMTGRGPGR